VDHSIPLLTAFLNPPEFQRSVVPGGVLTPEVAAGGIIMGSSDQVGNELDEFVTETLRNNLLGLPLDLATLNITRAREAGVPPLNTFRRQIFGAHNELKPYISWADFGQHLKHPESLINFVAAYGQHPSITSESTLAGKRAAAKAIVDPAVGTVPPPDAAGFMFGTGTWANTSTGVTVTGVDDIDLWIGGLAEKTDVNGGLLGSTFNYVFENQLTDLQNGDRFYYLARTAGMNLGSQIEGNSFAELIQRNTAGTTDSLKADVFATADCKFELKRLNGTPAGFAAQQALSGDGSTVADDLTTTGCDESRLLLRMPDGTIQYRETNSVDPPGVNGQSVYDGTPQADRVWGGNDNDTFWGGAGNDVIEGGGGNDVALGGDGNDIVTDLSGADILKGGPGNDALDGGVGNDILLGGDGQDFLNGAANDNQTFAGPGNDFVIAGQGADSVLGDDGDDWMQGGPGPDLLTGDHGAPFLDDPAELRPGNDILIGQGGDDTYGAEGGDDVMTSSTSIEGFVGAAGFDWATHRYDTVGADDDMKINNIGHAVANRDSWQETEAVSGSARDDVIRGDDAVPSTVGGAGLTGCDVLDQTGVDRISGLAALLPQPLTGNPAPVVAKSATGFCPLSGPTWGEGNILIGGAGSDTLEGRGGNDIIDGDRFLSVRISVRTNPADPATETGSTDLMEHVATKGGFGVGTAGMTLQQAVFAGLVDPGNLVAVREILTPSAAATAGNVDTAVFSDIAANYTVTTLPAGATLGAPGSKTTVVHNNGGANGTDTLRNIERLQFAPSPPPTTAVAPTGVTAVAGDISARVSWTPPGNAATSAITGYSVRVANAANVQIGALRSAAAGTTTLNVTGLLNGTAVKFQVAATGAAGTGAFSAWSIAVTPRAVVKPLAPAPGNRFSDFNADGHTDLVARDRAGSLWLYPGNGTGGFLPRRLMATFWNGFTSIVTPGDVTGDGNADVIVRTAAGTLRLYPGNGRGGLGASRQVGRGWRGMTISSAGDMTGDGRGDLLARDAAGKLWLFPVVGNGSIQQGRLVGRGWQGMTSILGVGDLSGDKRADILARDRAGRLWLYRGDGHGRVTRRTLAGARGWQAMTALATPGNLDRRAGNDLLARDAAGRLWFYPGTNTGRFGPRRQVGHGWQTMRSIT